ncbi:hypothetical protein B0H16DRAFT_1470570 [Mycena metata]|uniref:Uncharacterized protein n=1 Tax=Mycena metata TaxID=1033252 RepID=A0AAD7HVF4_9AGAR|nr:hypothetical protein B0H16DRAFT_1470570 [Mycena metata]
MCSELTRPESPDSCTKTIIILSQKTRLAPEPLSHSYHQMRRSDMSLRPNRRCPKLMCNQEIRASRRTGEQWSHSHRLRIGARERNERPNLLIGEELVAERGKEERGESAAKVPLLPPSRQLAALWRQFGGGTFGSQSCRAPVSWALWKAWTDNYKQRQENAFTNWLEVLSGGKVGGGGNVGGKVGGKVDGSAASVAGGNFISYFYLRCTWPVGYAAVLYYSAWWQCDMLAALFPLSNGSNLRAVHVGGSLAAVWRKLGVSSKSGLIFFGSTEVWLDSSKQERGVSPFFGSHLNHYVQQPNSTVGTQIKKCAAKVAATGGSWRHLGGTGGTFTVPDQIEQFTESLRPLSRATLALHCGACAVELTAVIHDEVKMK